MHQNNNQRKCGMSKADSECLNDEMKKMIEEIEEKAFMAGYDYAIEILKAGKVRKKEKRT